MELSLSFGWSPSVRGRSRKNFEGGSRVNISYNEGNPLKKHTALKICKGRSGTKGGGGPDPLDPPPLRQPLSVHCNVSYVLKVERDVVRVREAVRVEKGHSHSVVGEGATVHIVLGRLELVVANPPAGLDQSSLDA